MIRISEVITRCLIVLAVIRFIDSIAMGADEFEQPPIEYSESTPDNGLSRLQAAVAKKPESLKHESRYGYLRGLLEKLKITPESQILVYSKTSLQRSRISPRTPRAIYFNDDVYVGYCHNGDEIETAVADPRALLGILERAGFDVWFRYEKYREEFSAPDVVIAIDETPLGVFVEIEGTETGVSTVADQLGRQPGDYILASYRSLFAEHCSRLGVPVTNMVFDRA